jgi:hypothetical protein
VRDAERLQVLLPDGEPQDDLVGALLHPLLAEDGVQAREIAHAPDFRLT